MKDTLHIIPHTHWDREWYMSFERHRFRLVELLDTLIDVMEQNEEFRYFHLDGQTILIRDYLEIRPGRREAFLKLLREGRIQTGPWFVLQDEFLVSGEATVRNLMTGLRICRELGIEPVPAGYFPDAFGNIGQAPQILRGFGIDSAVFGRGLNVMGSDNQVMDQSYSPGSEMIWKSPDGSEVLGIMFVNWYHNAMELPKDPDKAKARLDELLRSTRRFARTPHLLGMNGCDHQPVQTDLPEALEVMRAQTDEAEIKISNFKDYVAAVKPYKDRLLTVTGELAGRYTSGWGLLENTASSRIDLKIKNHRAQTALEKQAEPLSAVAALYGKPYDREYFRYSWELLMQNHPHDSICCCSVDDVHREMNVRFDKTLQVTELLAERAAEFLTGRMNTAGLDGVLFAVFNKELWPVTRPAEALVDFPEDQRPESLILTDADGNEIPARFEFLGRTFTYDLPQDRFRQPKHVNRYRVTFTARDIPAGGWAVFAAKPGKSASGETTPGFRFGPRGAENEFVRFEIADNGTLRVTDKESGKVFDGFLYLEDAPDAGNEYTYLLPQGAEAKTTLGAAPEIKVVKGDATAVTYLIRHRLPDRADLYVTLAAGVPGIEVRAEIFHEGENRRIRACFDTGLNTDDVWADGQFDVVKRPITPWEGWTNPLHTERCTAFVELKDDEAGVLVAGRGLHEYEILRGKNTLALTLLRAVDQLGDWGYFPTPDSQMKGLLVTEFCVLVGPAARSAERQRRGAEFADDALYTAKVGKQAGDLPLRRSVVAVSGDFIRVSALKAAEERDTLILRLYNTDENPQVMQIDLPAEIAAVYETDLAENRLGALETSGGKLRLTVPAKKILTLELVK